ncbi:zinc-ribbon domain-containing protein [Pararhodobacter oceanensis]|uniref:zinc-ribbon domain-containing protein n=1 Tax=Pararhodobacter oceanensis TaxID=2172121 RepID=UPI003A8FCB73
MRLTCPNCSAQYEVDEKVIPQNGRDVQCSACGHTWYQYPMEVALQMRAAELDDDDDEDDEDRAEGPVGGAGGAAMLTPTDGTPRNSAPRIDKTVLDVLREEAEREMGERRRARGSDIETQGDLGLTRPTPSRAVRSRVYGEDDEIPPLPPEPDYDDLAPADAEPERVNRRNLLPDIEELTSTLEPGSEARDSAVVEEEFDAPPERNGFRNGLSFVALVGMALVAVYLLAPLIASYLPALEGALTQYVQAVDQFRATLAGALRDVIGGA